MTFKLSIHTFDIYSYTPDFLFIHIHQCIQTGKNYAYRHLDMFMLRIDIGDGEKMIVL